MKKFCIAIVVAIASSTSSGQGVITSPSSFQGGFGNYTKSLSKTEVIVQEADIKNLLLDRFMLNQSLSNFKFSENFQAKSRGPKEVALFKAVSPAVVLIISENSLGTGSLITSKGEVLTNWHVVGSNKEVGVIFKPALDTQKVTKNDIYRGVVVKIDQVADLALIKLTEWPANRQPVRLGSTDEISIGSDVHAIGHPRGESWTYTKGVISQFRNDYQWSGGKEALKHRADVIQTQTPINPGNSGGPLLSETGKMIGVNSFKAGDSEGLNFAVSIDDVKNFLSRKDNRYSAAPEQTKPATCEWKTVYEGKSEDKAADVISFDTQCSGKANLEIVKPYDSSRPFYLRADRNLDGKIDLLVLSYSRNEKWSLSYWDNDFDGKWDAVGFHPDGELKASRFEDFQAYSARLAKSK
jgi:S1-C subfamily serine protease